MPFGGSGFIPITFEIQGQQAVIGKLQTFGLNISDLSAAWEQIGLDLLDDFAANFDQEGGVFGKGAWAQWPALAPSTIADRLRRGYGGEHPILVREGTLRDSATVRGAPGNVFEVGANSLRVGTSFFTAPYHQWGTSRMPARKIVGLSYDRAGHGATGADSILGRLNLYVQQQVAAARLGL